ncbi:hypothetical protein [Thermofilum pendens]|uniref:Mechanosensitive ion channel n=1 Tax=Thermofilum pendens (strain DSM 2475 / Hrk 5) TaxID=368408 RepID=A1S192_THEPD|nr:hypothetical protein [Thermofilum pendens]ABL79222.1 hypothetical protein Tpen_1827 [Thermofilum pendens Hrk 5]
MPEWDVVQLFQQVVIEIAALAPKVGLATLILFVTLLVVKLVNKSIRWLVSVARLDEYLRKSLPEGTRIPLSTLLVLVADAGILTSSAALVVRVFVPEYSQAYREALSYISRIGSVAVLSLFSFVVIDALVKSMRMERKTERFFVMMSLLVVTLLIVDLASLSNEIKLALALGIAIGIGFLVGAFAAWAFFGEYLDALVRVRTGQPGLEREKNLPEDTED